MPWDLLDLHGFKSDDVIDAVDRFIVQSESRKLPRIRIMTGKGSGVVKKAVIDYLKQAQYPWEYESLPNGKRNEGVIVVFTG